MCYLHNDQCAGRTSRQVAFPGGAMEALDEKPGMTALREMHEREE